MFQELWSILYIYRALTVAKASCPHRLYKDPSQAISMRTIGNPEERNALIWSWEIYPLWGLNSHEPMSVIRWNRFGFFCLWNLRNREAALLGALVTISVKGPRCWLFLCPISRISLLGSLESWGALESMKGKDVVLPRIFDEYSRDKGYYHGYGWDWQLELWSRSRKCERNSLFLIVIRKRIIYHARYL